MKAANVNPFTRFRLAAKRRTGFACALPRVLPELVTASYSGRSESTSRIFDEETLASGYLFIAIPVALSTY